MLKGPSTTAMQPGLGADAELLNRLTKQLESDPFSNLGKDRARVAAIDYFAPQEPVQRVACGARLFERARHDPRLTPPLRHALLTTLDCSLTDTSHDYQAGGSPLLRLTSLDAWCTEMHLRVLDALAKTEGPGLPVSLTPEETDVERLQHTLLARVAPVWATRLKALCTANRDSWHARFVTYLRRLTWMTFDATLSSAGIRRLLAWLDTPGGRACLAARAALSGPLPPENVRPPSCDPPELVDLQRAMSEMISDAAGDEPYERTAYYMELAARVRRRLHGVDTL